MIKHWKNQCLDILWREDIVLLEDIFILFEQLIVGSVQESGGEMSSQGS